MTLEFNQKNWKNGEEGGTPIVAEELNRIEQAIAQLTELVNNIKEYAYSAPITNLLTTIAGNPLDATQGKALKDEIDSVNADLKNQISTINNNLNINTDCTINNTEYATWNYITCKKSGNIKTVSAYITVTEKFTPWNNLKIGQLSNNAYFPTASSFEKCIRVFETSSGKGYDARIGLSSSGEIMLYTTSEIKGIIFAIHLVYI